MNTDRLLRHFRISAAMRPYVLRIRLRGADFDFGSDPETAVAFTKCITAMRRILVQKRHIPTVAVDRAIQRTLEAAVDFQIADLRYRSLKTMEAQSHAALDRLIQSLRQLSDALAQLPATSKGELKKQVFAKIDRTLFDSEVFIEIIETLAEALPDIGPRRLADDVLSLIRPDPGAVRRPPIIDQWEAMPACMSPPNGMQSDAPQGPQQGPRPRSAHRRTARTAGWPIASTRPRRRWASAVSVIGTKNGRDMLNLSLSDHDHRADLNRAVKTTEISAVQQVVCHPVVMLSFWSSIGGD
jgi:hypothetical protein